MVFDVYAGYYDLLYRDKSYVAEAEYAVGHLRRRAPQVKHILELGCGTGGHAEHLARMGYVVTGVDLSESMLDRAESRKSKLPDDIAARISFRQGDVRAVRIRETYDAVVSLFHVMSYQVTDEDQAGMIDTAAYHLASGGVFLFDFWYGPAVLKQKPEVRVKRLEDNEIRVTRLAEPELHRQTNVVDVNYTVFVENKATEQIQSIQETHKMRYLFLPEVEALTQNEKWKDAETFAWMETVKPDEDHWAGCALTIRA
jgi:SAM-dependent methyltransferase